MPQTPQEQKAIVQRMLDAGESEDNIRTVIEHFKVQPETPPHQQSWLSKAADWLPTAGGAVGGIIGGIGGTVAGVGIGGAPGAIGGAAVGGATGEALKQLANRALGEKSPSTPFQAAGSIVGQGAIQGGMEATGIGVLKAAGAVAPALMQSAVKPAYKMVEKSVRNAEVPRVVQTLLDEGVNVTPGGIGKLQTLLKSTNDEIADIIRNSKASVFPENVVAAAQPVVAQAGKQVAPMADRAAASNVIDEFATVHGGAPAYPMRPIPVQQAQALKTGTYKAIGARAYGETKGAALEAEKGLARGLKEGIEAAHPEVKGLNAREGALIEARDAISKRVALAANRDPGGIGWIAENPKSFVAFLLARSPGVKSMLARGLYQSAEKATGVPQNLIRLGVQALASSQESQP